MKQISKNLLYEWQNYNYKYLKNISTRKVNAILLQSNKYIGTEKLIYAYLNYLLCINLVNDDPCGSCDSCVLFLQQSHPDLFVLEDLDTHDKKTKYISIEQIRELLSNVSLSSHMGKNKIVHIRDMNLLNITGANALLKILEEPPKDTIFLLQTFDINLVLPTIRSRCHLLNVSNPNHNQVIHYIDNSITNFNFWLYFYDNAPLFIKILDDNELQYIISYVQKPSIENIYSLSKLIDDVDKFAFFIEFIMKWVGDLILSKMTCKVKYFVEYEVQINKLSKLINLNRTFIVYDNIVDISPWSSHPLNYKLQIENLLFKYQQLFNS